MERGISPLISTVLLIGLVVALGVMTFSWISGSFRPSELIKPFEEETECTEVDIKILEAC